MNKIAVLFGGSGFIGTYLALELLKDKKAETVYLVDTKQPVFSDVPVGFREAQQSGLVKFIQLDVRDVINSSQLPTEVGLIVNLAAVHREPGHLSYEYYETNLPGAKNICDWADQVGCKELIFTSSISVYGSAEDGEIQAKSESTKPIPNTPYGISKLAAEKIHLEWQKTNPEKKLMIVRPGVVFGAGEHGNVTRMVHAIVGGYFMFTGNQHTRKAGGYVKELCRAIVWMMDKKFEQGVVLFNFTMDPAPSFIEYANNIAKTAGIARKVRSVPFGLLLAGSYLLAWVSSVLGKKASIDPVRVRKLLRSNYIVPQTLKDLGYQYQYNLETAMIDWKQEQPNDWQ